MWVIFINGVDSGISISGRDYYATLLAAIRLFGDDGFVEVVRWEKVS